MSVHSDSDVEAGQKVQSSSSGHPKGAWHSDSDVKAGQKVQSSSSVHRKGDILKIDSAQSVTDFTESLEASNVMKLWYHFQELMPLLLELREFVNVFKSYQAEIVQAPSPAMKMSVLLRFVKQCQGTGGLSSKLAVLLGQVVDVHFAPVSTVETIERSRKNLSMIANRKVEGVDFVALALAQKGVTANAEAVRLLKDEPKKVHDAMYAAMSDYLKETFEGAAVGGPPIEEYVGIVLSRAFMDGNYRLILRSGAWTNAWYSPADMDLPCMPWLTYGWNLCEVEALLCHEHLIAGGKNASKLFAELGYAVMPRFASDLAKFLATFEVKMQLVGHFRTKALAILASAAIAGGQLAGQYAWSLIKDTE